MHSSTAWSRFGVIHRGFPLHDTPFQPDEVSIEDMRASVDMLVDGHHQSVLPVVDGSAESRSNGNAAHPGSNQSTSGVVKIFRGMHSPSLDFRISLGPSIHESCSRENSAIGPSVRDTTGSRDLVESSENPGRRRRYLLTFVSWAGSAGQLRLQNRLIIWSTRREASSSSEACRSTRREASSSSEACRSTLRHRIASTIIPLRPQDTRTSLHRWKLS